MAQVRLSTTMCTKVKEKATAPFVAIMAEEEQKLLTNRRVHYMICTHLTNKEETDQAFALHARNPAWTTKTYLYAYLKVNQFPFTLNANNLPWPKGAHTNTTVEHTATPELKELVDSLLVTYFRAHTDKGRLEHVIDEVFEKCVNLDQALKVLPSLLDWVPDEYLVRHRDKTTRTKTKFDAQALQDGLMDDATISSLTRRRLKD